MPGTRELLTFLETVRANVLDDLTVGGVALRDDSARNVSWAGEDLADGLAGDALTSASQA